MQHDREIIRRWTFGNRWTLIVPLLCLLLSVRAEAGVPVISNQRVTDITTRSFSVVLTASEPSTAQLSLFASDCSTPVTGFTFVTQQNSASGNMRITISGLGAATAYCYQLALTSAATSQQTISAAAPVTTASTIVRTARPGSDILPIGNDILKVPAVHLPSGQTRDAIIASLELPGGTTVAPLSLLLSGNPDKDYFNLNNLFTTTTGGSLILSGSVRAKITENHGSGGCIIERFRKIPAASGGTAPRSFVQINPSDIDASGGVNILDVLRVVGGKGTGSAGPCFNSDLDLNGDGVIDAGDLTIIKGGFNGLP